MATSLPPNATPAEIEEELVFAKVLADSLDQGAEDYADQLAEAQARVAELESMLGLSPDTTLMSPTLSHGSGFGGQDITGLDGLDERGMQASGLDDADLEFGSGKYSRLPLGEWFKWAGAVRLLNEICVFHSRRVQASSTHLLPTSLSMVTTTKG